MNRLFDRAAALALALAAAACATRAPHPEAFAFGIVGDTPYDPHEVVLLDAAIDAMNAEPLAFVVHVGDMKAGGNSPCTDDIYRERKRQLERIAHPFHPIPGDNDWVDCRRQSNGAMDPIERLKRLREIFYADTGASAPHRFAGAARQAGYPENARWARSGVVFTTLNVQGSDDNAGVDAANDAEQATRMRANLAWLAEAFAEARRGDARGLAVIFHANPLQKSKGDVYEPLLEALRTAAAALRRPVAVIHGDTHWQRVDHPFAGADGRTIPNLVRMETYGSPWVGWVKVFVDPADPGLFRFEPRLQ